ncbi:hypothetical protein [Phycisphaera mikurensis]|uniref:Uncharacterized protein n=1 Tax=Phycisphaera mikurensis (strain NBRC 102666 / KCTC 22515 / FYK2301M01) TaxID=1142394 RepID=I0ICV2_PHYMF|nr:hypothetical protein [Phycisphaera mikurensis]MBB6443293.1 hypothetical protein [Phycisphaera mikurensis]BAM03090.1 hypothetical protein PSMK_09310 [Phycisphaera mikurensis NBRC 102666]
MPRPDCPPDFLWTPQPAAQAVVDRLIARFVSRHPFAATLADRLASEAGVRLGDLVESIQLEPVGPHDGLEAELRGVGFEGAADRLVHPGGIFPTLRLMPGGTVLGFRVESVEAFAETHALRAEPTGREGDRLRTVAAEAGSEPGRHTLLAVERHGWAGFEAPDDPAPIRDATARWREAFRARPRGGAADGELFEALEAAVRGALEELPRDLACDLFFEAERDFWTARNRAAGAQLRRQRALGIGWANHDHHTYRSSRGSFARMIAVFESLGLACRESFTPGPDAGWGAQVLEQPVTRIVIFADVDMTPEELLGDFAHEGLTPRQELGTVGLWCGLHGESILGAGMHHLECVFGFDLLREQLLAGDGIGMMDPFSSFDHLKQQFTEGEVWPVQPHRIRALLEGGRITAEQAERFAREGAIGSHLENLERNDGFKGFNQEGVTDIIQRTDARAAARA